MFKQFIIAVAILFLLTTGAGQALAEECNYFNSNSYSPDFPLDTSPQDAAIIIFEQNTQSFQGRKFEGFTINYQYSPIYAALLNEEFVGLGDDSVQGIRYCLRFIRFGFYDWKLDWAGQQVKCWPGRGHEDWGPERCR